MGYRLRRALREALGPDISGLPRAVALEIADDAHETTRVSRASLEQLARWTAAKNTGVVRDALKRLSAAGWEFREPIGKGADGRLLYAVPGRALMFRVPEFDSQGRATTRPKGESPHALGDGKGESGLLGKESGLLGKESGLAPSPSSPSFPLSPRADPIRRLLADVGLTDEREITDFVDWTNRTHGPRGIGWWRTVAKNGDLAALVAEWRAQKPEAGPSLPPWCGSCGDDNPAAEKNPRFRRTDGAPCPRCHPDALEATA